MGFEDSSSYENKSKYVIIFHYSINFLAYILIGITLGIILLVAFQNGLPVGATPQHMVLCVIGYQLLMSAAIFSLSSDSGWVTNLKLVDKKRVHWVLMIAGSGLAIAGSIIKILDKNVHWDSLHGQFALVALVFTGACLCSGILALYAYEIKGYMNPNLLKALHICGGIVAYGASCISLCYGLDKNFFKNNTSVVIGDTLITFVATFTFICFISPVVTFYRKSLKVMKRS